MFQSTRPRRARPRCQLSPVTGHKRFNPRAREGRDLLGQRRHRGVEVSIHAPAKGATPNSFGDWYCVVFQSTRPRRARPPPSPQGATLRRVSIHAPAKGATRAASSRGRSARSFNPRAREGRDLLACLNVGTSTVSIHAPAKGATLISSNVFASKWFQSTRPRRARQIQGPQPWDDSGFNPRAREGRDSF